MCRAALRPRLLITRLKKLVREDGNTLENGELLEAAEQAGFDLFITTDKNLRYQQNLTARKIAIIILGSGRWTTIKLHLTAIADAVNSAAPRTFVEVKISER